ncbi:hypothetical protein LV78_005845 [Actinosynnema pretiosum]|nr:hypothetical protein [Actinosynnema pretiosum]
MSLAASGDQRDDPSLSQGVRVGLAVVAAVGEHHRRPPPRASGFARDTGQGVEHLGQGAGVVGVGRADRDGQRVTSAVDDQVVFRPALAAVDRAQAGEAPLLTPSRGRSRAPHGTSRSCSPRATRRASPRADAARPLPRPIRAFCGGRSNRSRTPTRWAGRPTRSRYAARTESSADTHLRAAACGRGGGSSWSGPGSVARPGPIVRHRRSTALPCPVGFSASQIPNQLILKGAISCGACSWEAVVRQVFPCWTSPGVVVSNLKRPVRLLARDREELIRWTTTGAHPASPIMRAWVLLALDTSAGEPDPKEVVAARLGVSDETLRWSPGGSPRPAAVSWPRSRARSGGSCR